MVVDDFDFLRLVVDPEKAYPILLVNPNAMPAIAITG